MSPSYSVESFSREYASIWSGNSEESWFNFDKMSKYRRIKNPETHAIFRANSNQFYLLSVDVGRIHDQTVISVFRVNISADRKYYATLVNLFVIGREAHTKTFEQQAIEIKRIIRDFNPKEVVIDTNGLGIGLGDEMIKVQYDEFGEQYPAYGFFNDDEFKKSQPKDAPQILYSFKANGPLKSKVHSNVYFYLSNGLIRFLINEQEAKSALLSTKIGQRMSLEERIKRLMPHEMTTKLFEEAANLRLKRSGSSTDIILEQINTRYPDDKYMSFAYGLWRIKEISEEENRKYRWRTVGPRKLTFFTGGK